MDAADQSVEEPGKKDYFADQGQDGDQVDMGSVMEISDNAGALTVDKNAGIVDAFCKPTLEDVGLQPAL